MGAACSRAWRRLRKLAELYSVALERLRYWVESFSPIQYRNCRYQYPRSSALRHRDHIEKMQARVEPQRYVVISFGIFEFTHF